jgi:formyl-CoA transferase
MGRPELAEDPRFASAQSRIDNSEHLDKYVSEWTSGLPKREIMKILGRAGVACGAVLDSLELLSDPHLQQRGMVVPMQHPTRGDFPMLGCPVRLDDSPVEIKVAPLLGQHNREVYGEYLGLGESALAELRRDGVI